MVKEQAPSGLDQAKYTSRQGKPLAPDASINAYHGTDPLGRPACFVPAPTERHLRNKSPETLLDQAAHMELTSQNYVGETSVGMRRRAGQILDHAIEAEKQWFSGNVDFDQDK